ncbi:hypothetical protein [Jiangella alkaliphila]|uniref:hypothetical protein n=1 Tax=Jiangella alkaliphila TaxID=419479 RepID=UPI00128E7811|nr:hypothetical protein [Jiangella alkaliphila]
MASRFRVKPVFGEQIDWETLGVEPRWLGQDTSECAAAFDPGQVFGHGVDEVRRFLAGAKVRGETALLVATIGVLDDDSPRSAMRTHDSSVSLPDLTGYISGRRLPSGTQPILAPGLTGPDRDLGLRLLNGTGKTWWALSLSGLTLQPGSGGPAVHHPAQGRLEPILQDALGDPLVAVWLPDDADERWYIVPDGTNGKLVVDWLVQQALPTFVPNALRRVRSPHFHDPDLQTTAEAGAAEALAEMNARHAQEATEAEDALRQARESAEPIRYGLLFSTGKPLEDAVAAVLRDAGLTVVDLDRELGTKSADLLVSVGGHHVLIEVKSASGAPSESLVGDLQRHLATWPELKPGVPVGTGVLIVNHHIRTDPSLRHTQVYTRAEFVASLAVAVVSTRELFDWWRRGDWESIQHAILPPRMTVPRSDPMETSKSGRPRRRSRWPFGR